MKFKEINKIAYHLIINKLNHFTHHSISLNFTLILPLRVQKTPINLLIIRGFYFIGEPKGHQKRQGKGKRREKTFI